VTRFFDTVYLLKEEGIFSFANCIQLVEDLFTNIPQNEVENLFSIIETKVFTSVSNPADYYPCIKVCSFIMRQLQLTLDIGFKGRIQKRISKYFPLNHQSGVNKSGMLNINKTFWQSKEKIEKEISDCKIIMTLSPGRQLRLRWKRIYFRTVL